MELRRFELAASRYATIKIAVVKDPRRQADELGALDVRFGSKADICGFNRDVRF